MVHKIKNFKCEKHTTVCVYCSVFVVYTLHLLWIQNSGCDCDIIKFRELWQAHAMVWTRSLNKAVSIQSIEPTVSKNYLRSEDVYIYDSFYILRVPYHVKYETFNVCWG